MAIGHFLGIWFLTALGGLVSLEAVQAGPQIGSKRSNEEMDACVTGHSTKKFKSMVSGGEEPIFTWKEDEKSSAALCALMTGPINLPLPPEQELAKRRRATLTAACSSFLYRDLVGIVEAYDQPAVAVATILQWRFPQGQRESGLIVPENNPLCVADNGSFQLLMREELGRSHRFIIDPRKSSKVERLVSRAPWETLSSANAYYRQGSYSSHGRANLYEVWANITSQRGELLRYRESALVSLATRDRMPMPAHPTGEDTHMGNYDVLSVNAAGTMALASTFGRDCRHNYFVLDGTETRVPRVCRLATNAKEESNGSIFGGSNVYFNPCAPKRIAVGTAIFNVATGERIGTLPEGSALFHFYNDNMSWRALLSDGRLWDSKSEKITDPFKSVRDKYTEIRRNEIIALEDKHTAALVVAWKYQQTVALYLLHTRAHAPLFLDEIGFERHTWKLPVDRIGAMSPHGKRLVVKRADHEYRLYELAFFGDEEERSTS